MSWSRSAQATPHSTSEQVKLPIAHINQQLRDLLHFLLCGYFVFVFLQEVLN